MVDDICPICQTRLALGQDPCPSCGAARGPGTLTRNLPAGHALQQGKFTVGRVLGEGGFGITYKGAHRDLGRPVAIKEYFPPHAQRVGTAISVSASLQAAFARERVSMLQEAQLLFGLRDPGIVQVYDAFQENGTAYIVMEYLEGRTLEERIRQAGRIPADEVQRLAQALGQALEAVHAQRLLHRDIKPANIMLTPEGRIVLIDFGSARAFQRNLTQRHTRIMTPGYAAPEQYSEEARFGPYTDIFGLGATLYHALTGAPPPPAIDRLQSGDALSLPAGMPAPFATAVQQALELRVDDRPSSVTAFLNLMQQPPSTGIATPAVASASPAGTKSSRMAFPASGLDSDREAVRLASDALSRDTPRGSGVTRLLVLTLCVAVGSVALLISVVAQPAAVPVATEEPASTPTRAAVTVPERSHVIRAGDTLWNLAEAYLGASSRWQEIVALNPEVQFNRLRTGQEIRIPPQQLAETEP